MEVKPGFKQSDVGIIPEDWETNQLRSFVRRHNSGVYKKSELYGRGCNIIGVSNLYSIDCVDGQHFAQVPLSAVEQAKHTLSNNDLLYGESSLVREGIARTVYVTELGAGTAFAWHTRRYAVDQSSLVSPYLYYYLQSRPARKHMMDQSIQTAITGINTDAYFSCPVLLPPLPEQRTIATALRDVDALLGALERLIAKKRDLKQAAMQQLLTGQTRLPGFSGKWRFKKIGECLKVRHGKSQKAVEAINGRYPVLASGGEIGRANDFIYDKESVLIGRKGTIDEPQYVDKPFWSVDTLFFTEIFPSACPKFIFYKFTMIDWRKYNEASGVPSLNASTIEDIDIYLCAIDEQEAIATVFSEMDDEIAALEARRDKTRAVKQGMMQELLTGKTRLVDPGVSHA
jgi:type I restriction enzyme, S subunit